MPSRQNTFPSRKLLWAAGDIGLTPLLAMLTGLRGTADGEGEVSAHSYNIILVLSGREPEVLLPLMMRAARCRDDDARASSLGTMTIHLFSRSPLLSSTLPTADIQLGLTVDVKWHMGRLSRDAFQGLGFEDVAERESYVCGPEEFEEVVLGVLNVDSDKVRREGFAY
ncbi:hypothetical protein PAXINDRAFT_17934 [Paxillus involutus ATCC 200175]|uniref:Oxidoreductase FAD/NAD(P)-binding domain-containing protein n=1 Tax=Paxillus involutus ATCC 200175 TaxID=664439 RepID=A0A0C9TD65_PAXIN|nr:hypothetical protein PAXINDRAFT_17934 [Paxillus involutus ATCC 200175]